jgi:hypothetical protein
LNYGQNLTVHKLSAQAAGVDPVFFFPRISGGGYAALVDTLVVFSGPAAAGTVTLLNKAGGTDLTVAGMPAGTAAGMLVFNSAGGSYAFVVSMSGSTATMTQPISTSLATTIGIPTLALGTNWATGDTITVYNKPNATNLKAWRPTGGDVGSSAGVSWVQFTQVVDSSGSGASEYPCVNDCASTVFSCCYIAPRLQLGTVNGRGQALVILGCFSNVVINYSAECEFYAGIVAGSFTQQGVGVILDGNLIIVGLLNIVATTTIGSAHIMASGIQFTAGAVLRVSATLWGQGGLNLSPGCVYENTSGTTFAASLLTSGALTFGATGTGSGYVGSGVFTDGITLTPAHIDTGAAGGAGLQDILTGARFCNPQ